MEVLSEEGGEPGGFASLALLAKGGTADWRNNMKERIVLDLGTGHGKPVLHGTHTPVAERITDRSRPGTRR
jgi:hypothetical protein